MTYLGGMAIASELIALLLLCVDVLGGIRLLRAPAIFVCRCGSPGFRQEHLNSLMLIVAGLMWLPPAVYVMLVGDPVAVIFAGFTGAYLARWWKHTKRRRKRLAKRVLGVVRETTAGRLRVVPVLARLGGEDVPDA